MLLPLPYNWRLSNGYQKAVKWSFYLGNGLATLLNCIDIIYYRFTMRRTTGTILKEFQHEENKGSLGWHFLWDYWYIVLAFISLIWLMVFLYNRLKTKKKVVSNIGWGYYVFATVFLFGFIPLEVGGIRGDFKHSTRPITISNAGDYVSRPQDIYLVLNTPFTFVRTLGSKGIRRVNYFSNKEVENIYSPIHQPTDSNIVMDKKNIVILILESFGKEAVGFYNQQLDGGTYTGFTPFLDSLSNHSLIFWDSYANGRKSIDAIPSVISSIPSEVEPFALTPYVSDSMQTLAHILNKQGYGTSFFHGAPNGSMGFRAVMNLMGVEEYYGKDEFNNDAEYDGIWGIWDEPFLQFFEKKISSFQQPFISVLFTVSSHHPFKLPKQYAGKFKKGPLPVLECISYTDMGLQKFFIKASKEPWFKNTLFVITADHSTVTYHDEYANFWGECSIPILLYSPGDTNFKGVRNQTIQQIDIMPTVLGYLGYSQPYFAYGQDVLHRKDSGFVFNYNGDYTWLQDDYLLVFDGEKTRGLYDFKTDRVMKRNLMNQQKSRVNDMEKRLKAFIQQYRNRLIDNKLNPNS
ncbi:MAG: LTA synthase family protein [Niabella sp.]